MTIIEKVARAICSASGDNWDRSILYIVDRRDTPETAQEVYRDQARAALEAMREPTDGMIDMGCAAQILLYPAWDGEKPKPTAGDVVSASYTAMIDSALKEEA